ncbi:fish-egg lectin isoform X2 [Amia ocellicauda]|uniref:fish-egg lectin isoform X2 n=1 Tax=Amia ocellicauda TaxID=2972642 RepID=UPI003464CB3C
MRGGIVCVVLLVGSGIVWVAEALQCEAVPGVLQKIDAGAGRVCGITEERRVVVFRDDSWVDLQASGDHVSVGPAGLWNVGVDGLVSKWFRKGWVQVNPGNLIQIDAGGDKFVVGCNASHSIFCLNHRPALSYDGSGSVSWVAVPGELKYYSCGPVGCWGVNKLDEIHVKLGVSGNSCHGPEKWYRIPGSLSMVEVSTDGQVHGVNKHGLVFKRIGVSACNPFGSGWEHLRVAGLSKHVSYDHEVLWIICRNGEVQRCRFSEALSPE